MLMRCLDYLIRHVVIGWQVSDIDVKSRGVRRRRRNYFMGGGAHAPRCAAVRVKDIAFKSRNYFMGTGGGAHAPRCAALKTLLLRNEILDGDAIITLWGRRAARTRRGAPRRVNCVRMSKAATVT